MHAIILSEYSFNHEKLVLKDYAKLQVMKFNFQVIQNFNQCAVLVVLSCSGKHGLHMHGMLVAK